MLLHYHDGVTVIFADFQLNALSFVHRALYALTGYAAGDSACRRCQGATRAAANGVTEEAAEHRAADSADGVAVISALNLHRTGMHNGAVGHALDLFGFRCGVNIAGQAAAADAACKRKTNHRDSQNT